MRVKDTSQTLVLMTQCLNVPAKAGLYHTIHVFQKYILWQWDALLPPYINSPFLVLDKLDDTAKNNNTTVEKSNKNKAEFSAGNSTQNEFTAETSNENRTGKCIEEPIHTD